MFKFRSLFWKIFFAFWLASLFVIFATIFVVLKHSKTIDVKEKHRQKIEQVSRVIVDAYEEGVPFQSIHQAQKRFRRMPELHAFHRHHWLKILDSKHKEIFFHDPKLMRQQNSKHKPKPGERPNWDVINRPIEHSISNKKSKPRKRISFEFTSASGERYRVETNPGVVPMFMRTILHGLTRLQFVLILLASSVVSVLLTWMITRPLKILGAFSRNFADGDFQLRLDDVLLTRGDEIGELARDFNAMAIKVSQNFEFQQQLMHDVSHELRAPLARLQAASAILQQQSSDGDSKMIERIDLECERIDKLIQGILDYTRMEQAAAVKSAVNVEVLLGTVLENVQFEFKARTINIGFDDDCSSQQLFINGYLDLLQSALENILRNACKYSPASTLIEITVSRAPEFITIRIRDFGPGIDEGECEKLLTPFYRGGNEMHTEGFGLGLSIAQRVAKKHDGCVLLENHPGGGLDVSMQLPCDNID